MIVDDTEALATDSEGPNDESEDADNTGGDFTDPDNESSDSEKSQIMTILITLMTILQRVMGSQDNT